MRKPNPHVRLLASLVATGIVALTLVGVSAPAQAASCEYGNGVTVVVQGQGMNSTVCVPGGGKVAKDAFGAAGHPLTFTQRFPGFVCRVSGKPASDPCQTSSPTDAYWALFWSDGQGGGWRYAGSGVGGLNIGQGGWVAFKFQNSNTRKNPSGSPMGPKPAPTQRPATKPAPKPSPAASATSGGQTTATPSATPTSGRTVSPTPNASQSASSPAASNVESDRSEAADSSSQSEANAGLGIGTWIVILGLLAAGGLLGWRIWHRR